jgi:hypothetical protein
MTDEFNQVQPANTATQVLNESPTDAHIPGNACIGLGKQLGIVGVLEHEHENERGNFL